jgi:hypothetical protein
MRKKRGLYDAYQFPGFHPEVKSKGIFGDPVAQVVVLKRRQKKQNADNAEQFIRHTTITRHEGYGTYPVEAFVFISKWKSDEYRVGCVER